MKHCAIGLCLGALLCAGAMTSLEAGGLDAEGSGGIGVGVMLGEPTGFNAKGWIGEHSAIDGAIGWSFAEENNLELHADYLYHLFDVLELPSGRLPIYFGGGLHYKVRDDRDDEFGFRTVAGLDYLLENTPVDIFFELGPVFNVTPDFDVDLTVAVGVRFWF